MTKLRKKTFELHFHYANPKVSYMKYNLITSLEYWQAQPEGTPSTSPLKGCWHARQESAGS
jgi:hypothetical protein